MTIIFVMFCVIVGGAYKSPRGNRNKCRIMTITKPTTKTPTKTPTKTRKRAAKPNHYIDNEEFHEVMVRWKQRCAKAELEGKERPRLPDYFGWAVHTIATRYSSKPNWSGYTYRDEMIMDGVESCIRYAHNYDTARPEKNPLAYFTKTITYAFYDRLDREHKQQYIKAKYIRSANHIIDDDEMLNGFDDFISKYEAKMKARKMKAAERKAQKLRDEMDLEDEDDAMNDAVSLEDID